jgi:hypothetical protein
MLLSPFLVPIVAIVIFGGGRVFRSWLAFKERQLEQASAQAAEKAAQYAAKTERLEQRVAVLERILTDRSAHLSDEIERLRDQPLN